MNRSDYGFELIDGKYNPKWNDGDISPPSIESITITEDNDEDDNDWSDEEDELSDLDVDEEFSEDEQ